MRAWLLCLAVSLLLVGAPGAHATWWKDLLDPNVSFWSPYSAGSTDLEVLQVGFTVSGSIACFGDFNADGYTDMFVIVHNDQALDQLLTLTWSGGSSTEHGVFSSGNSFVEEMEISSAVASDFNYDGMLDVLVQGRTNTSSFMNVYFGNLQSLSAPVAVPSPPHVDDQVLLLDANMDMKVDLFGTSENGTRTFWINQGDGKTWTTVPLAGAEGMPPIDMPHSNAFVDINGDCLSDLIITSNNGSRYLEVWLNSDASGTPEFSLADILELPQGAGQVTFSDLDRDGTMDFVFPVCWPQPSCSEVNSIVAVYNKQQTMCTSITGGGTGCMNRADICIEAEYELSVSDTNGNGTVVVDKSSFPNGSTFFWNYHKSTPCTLRTGDWNMDGYDDLLITVQQDNEYVSQIWQSTSCDDGNSACGESNSGRRYFVLQNNGTAALATVPTSYAATWFDIGEDGTLDIFAMSDDALQNAQSPSLHITAFANNVDHGGYFMKTLGLNGLCSQWCLGSDVQPKFPDPKPVGVNMPGVVFKYTQTNNDGEAKLAAGNPLSQSAYLSLQVPYAYFGLGDVSNYVSALYIGIPITGSKSKFSSFPDMLPNSHVIVFPSPPTSVFRWTYDMRMVPSGLTFYTVTVAIICCILLTIPIVYVAWKEKKEIGRAHV